MGLLQHEREEFRVSQGDEPVSAGLTSLRPAFLSMVSRRLVLTTWMYLSVVSFFLWPKTFCKSAMDIPLLTLCALKVLPQSMDAGLSHPCLGVAVF